MHKEEIKFIKISPDRWEEYKALQLEALEKEPLAFGASYEAEASKSSGYWKKNLVRAQKDNTHWTILFAEIEGVLVGMGVIKFARHKKFKHIARFSSIYLKKEYRGQGIAKKLLSELIKQTSLQPRISKIKLIVNTTQEPAIALYKSLGFEVIGELKQEFKIDDKFYDGYLMELFKI